MKLTKFVSIGIALALGASASILSSSSSRAFGAEKVILTFGPIGQAINISELEEFAKDGTTTATLKQIIGFSKMDPKILQGLIGLQIGLKPANLARVVYSTPGEKITDEIGQAIRTQRRTEGGKALRAAVILASGDDGKVSLLEILKKYPLPEVYVDVASIAATVGKIQGLAGNLSSLLQDSMRETTRTTQTNRVESPIAPPRSLPPTTPPPARRVAAPLPAPLPAPAPQPVRPVRGLW